MLLEDTYEIAQTWNMMKPTTMSKTWKQTFSDNEENTFFSVYEGSIFTVELPTTLKHKEGCENVNNENSEQ
jgi:hypothetical protein